MHRAVARAADRDVVDLGAAVAERQHGLAAGLGPAHRPAERGGEAAEQELLGVRRPILAPNPPPTSGVMTRTPPARAVHLRQDALQPCAGCDVAHCMQAAVLDPGRGRPSGPRAGTAATRWLTRRCDTTTSQPAKRSSVAAGIPMHRGVAARVAAGRVVEDDLVAQRVVGVDDDRQRVVVDDHELGGVLALLGSSVTTTAIGSPT